MNNKHNKLYFKRYRIGSRLVHKETKEVFKVSKKNTIEVKAWLESVNNNNGRYHCVWYSLKQLKKDFLLIDNNISAKLLYGVK